VQDYLEVLGVVKSGPKRIEGAARGIAALWLCLSVIAVVLLVALFYGSRQRVRQSTPQPPKSAEQLFTGGEGAEAWRAKLTIRGNRIAEREVACGSAQPVLRRYLPAPVLLAAVSLITNSVISVHLSEQRTIPQQVQP
jgi:hypothetical protein